MKTMIKETCMGCAEAVCDDCCVHPEVKTKIDGMTQVEMAWSHRFAPAGSPLHSGAAGIYFQERFQKLGGMTPSISKSIGL